MTSVVFETGRLRAIEFTTDHRASLKALFNDPINASSFGYRMHDEAIIDDLLLGYKEDRLVSPRQAFRLAVHAREDDGFVGFCNTHHIPGRTELPEVGVTIASDKTGRGYATEIIGGLARFALAHFDTSEIAADCNPKNPGSIIMLARNGFRPVALNKDDFFNGRETEDTLAWRYTSSTP